MINGEKIGVGVISGFRPELYWKCMTSLPFDIIDCMVVVNDKPSEYLSTWNSQVNMIKNKENLGVGISKNKALEKMMDEGCDHFFIIEEDIFIKDPSVFEKYIKASKASGIQHFNFSQHGMMNKSFDQFRTPNPRWTVNYGEESVALYPHCVGAFSYYSRNCLETVGLLDEDYFNACEHVDHTYEVIKAGMHPPFWWFADIANSWDYLGDEEWSIEKSTISSNPKHKEMMQAADKIFIRKHGHLPGHTPDIHERRVGEILKQIKMKYGANTTNL